jgi:hypothetical protein
MVTMGAKMKSLKFLLLVAAISATLVGCNGGPRTDNSVSKKILNTDVVQTNETGTSQVVEAIKKNTFYWESDGMCFAGVLTLAYSSYPVLSFTCVPCEKARAAK